MPITWSHIEKQFTPDAAEHLARAQSLGLDCPLDVFEQLFHDHRGDETFASIVRFVDWGTVQWEEADLSGVALRRLSVPRLYQRAVDEARWRTFTDGLQDDRPEVIEHWHTAGTWLRPPILIAGELAGSSLSDTYLVGFTRIGYLLGLLDRQHLPEASLHRIWLGRGVSA